LAQLLLDKLEVDPKGKKHGHAEKVLQSSMQLGKLTQWKNKKFRELMTAKTFIELNSKKHESEGGSDPLK